jgi:hypothetical protein
MQVNTEQFLARVPCSDQRPRPIPEARTCSSKTQGRDTHLIYVLLNLPYAKILGACQHTAATPNFFAQLRLLGATLRVVFFLVQNLSIAFCKGSGGHWSVLSPYRWFFLALTLPLVSNAFTLPLVLNAFTLFQISTSVFLIFRSRTFKRHTRPSTSTSWSPVWAQQPYQSRGTKRPRASPRCTLRPGLSCGISWGWRSAWRWESWTGRRKGTVLSCLASCCCAMKRESS